MGKFNIKSAPIEGLQIIKPEQLGEPRDYLHTPEAAAPLMEQLGLEEQFVEFSGETLPRGVMRGLYFQRRDAQGRLVAITEGRALVVAVDLRPELKSFGAAYSIELKAEWENMLYLPPYFALGWLSLEANTQINICSTTESNKESSAGIIWDDEILAIDWQLERYDIDERRINILQRDKKFPSFRSYNQNTLWLNRPKKKRVIR